MNQFRWLLAKIPLLPLLMITIFLGMAPFTPEPHLWEKLKMLAAGTLVRPVDIFDLLMHASPALLLIIKLLFEQKGDAINTDKP